jgi:hypothetical protein
MKDKKFIDIVEEKLIENEKKLNESIASLDTMDYGKNKLVEIPIKDFKTGNTIHKIYISTNGFNSIEEFTEFWKEEDRKMKEFMMFGKIAGDEFMVDESGKFLRKEEYKLFNSLEEQKIEDKWYGRL